jgi:lipopolysaccharide export LptBFGC system permease protein LptF
MKLYWSINSIPELADLPKQNRGKAWRNTYLKHWFKVGFLPILIVAVSFVAGTFFGQNYSGHFGRAICAVIAVGISGFIAWEIEANMIRPYLREDLKSNEKTNQPSL